MGRLLSEQLSDLSVRAKNAEDALVAAQKEAHDKVVARREQSRAAVNAAMEKVDQDLRSAGDAATANWNALKAKLASDLDALKSGIEQKRHDKGVQRAENYADLLDREAECSVDYAIASIEQAKLAVLDAIVGRVEAEQARKS
jgi:ElaB/YqjD/DUF883 family membrane-anchored ribosome-binding protein